MIRPDHHGTSRVGPGLIEFELSGAESSSIGDLRALRTCSLCTTKQLRRYDNADVKERGLLFFAHLKLLVLSLPFLNLVR